MLDQDPSFIASQNSLKEEKRKRISFHAYIFVLKYNYSNHSLFDRMVIIQLWIAGWRRGINDKSRKELRRKSVTSKVKSRLDMLECLKNIWAALKNIFQNNDPNEPRGGRDLEMGDGYSLSKSRIERGIKKFMEDEG